jgi:hypothetical protein
MAAHSKPSTTRAKPAVRRWSARVNQTSNALDLDPGVFQLRDPRRIAASLKRSADRSKRRKSEPYRSAMSMLIFYINRAGKNLSAARRRTLERAKGELRAVYGRPPTPRRSSTARGPSKARRSPTAR